MTLSENHLFLKTLYDFFEHFGGEEDEKVAALAIMLQQEGMAITDFNVTYLAVIHEHPQLSSETTPILEEKWSVIGFKLEGLTFFEGQWHDVDCVNYWENELLSRSHVVSVKVKRICQRILRFPPIGLADTFKTQWDRHQLEQQTVRSSAKKLGPRL